MSSAGTSPSFAFAPHALDDAVDPFGRRQRRRSPARTRIIRGLFRARQYVARTAWPASTMRSAKLPWFGISIVPTVRVKVALPCETTTTTVPAVAVAPRHAFEAFGGSRVRFQCA